MDFSSLLPFLLAKKQEENAGGNSAFNLLGGLPKQTNPIIPQQNNPNFNTEITSPTLGTVVPEAGSIPELTPMQKMQGMLKKPEVWQSLLLSGASALDGNPLSKTAALGFGNYQNMVDRKAKEENAKFNRGRDLRAEERANKKLDSTLETQKLQRDKYRNDMNPDKELSKIEKAELELKNAQIAQTKARAAALYKEAKKSGVKGNNTFDEDRAAPFLNAGGYVDELTGEMDYGKAFSDPEFFKNYNFELEDGKKFYKRVDGQARKDLNKYITDPSYDMYDMGEDQIKEKVSDFYHDVYSPKDIENLQAYAVSRIKARMQQQKNEEEKEEKRKLAEDKKLKDKKEQQVKDNERSREVHRLDKIRQMSHGTEVPKITTTPFNNIVRPGPSPELLKAMEVFKQM